MRVKSFRNTLGARSESPSASSKALFFGAFGWILFCMVAVAWRGVRWDEQYEMAQIVLGIVRYPEGHPASICMRNALNLQIYLSSGLLWFFNSALAVCAFRNVLFLAATVLPIYLIGSTLSKNVLCGHLAALLALFGMQDAFAGCYPLSTWPGYFSTGHVGQGYALLVFWMFLAGHLRTGAFFLGLMPCFHIGQMPIVLGFAILGAGYALYVRRGELLKPALPWLVLGLALCSVVWLGRGFLDAPLATGGVYFSTADAKAIWRDYETHDAHRALPGGPVKYTNAFFALGVFLFLGSAAAFSRKRGEESCNLWAGMLAYGLVAAAAVWGIMPLHALLGESTPYILIGWMPYRFTNHAVLLLIPLLVALLWGRNSQPSTGRWLLALGMILALARPLSALVLPEWIYARYVASGEGILFLLCGVAIGAMALELRGSPKFRAAWRIAGAIAFCALAAQHQFGAACLAMGYGLARILSRLSGRSRSTLCIDTRNRGGEGRRPRLLFNHRDIQNIFACFRQPRASALPCFGLAIVTAAALLGQQAWHRQQLPVTSFDREVRAYLERHGEGEAMLVARPDQYTGQARIGHPFLVDGSLPGWIPYMPSVGPVLDKIHREVYGFSLGLPENGPSWEEVWASRAPFEWERLAAAYGFRYVLAPSGIQVRLPVVLRCEREALYRVGR